MGAVSISRQENPRRLELLLNSVLPPAQRVQLLRLTDEGREAMRLLILGSLAGQLGAASRIAIGRGAKVLQADRSRGRA